MTFRNTGGPELGLPLSSLSGELSNSQEEAGAGKFSISAGKDSVVKRREHADAPHELRRETLHFCYSSALFSPFFHIRL